MKRKSNRSKDSVLPGSGRLRCHCGSPAVLRSAEGLCRVHQEGAMAYVCSRYPDCDSFVMAHAKTCLLYTSPSPRDRQKSRMPSSA